MVSCPVKMAPPPGIHDKGPKDYKAMGKLFCFFSRSRNCGKDGAFFSLDAEPGPEQLMKEEKTTCEKSFTDNSIKGPIQY